MPPTERRSWRRCGSKLQAGDKSLVGNKGYRRYLAATGPDHFQIDEAKIEEEARYDGKWVLRTNTELDAAEVALQYKRLWMVEHWFRSCKSLLQTRPIFHRCDETIRGHVFCSFLALVLRQELQARLAARRSRVRVGRRDPGSGPVAGGGGGAGREAVLAAERGAGDVRGGVPRGGGGRAPDRAAGPTGPCGHGAGSWCHAAFVDLQIATLQWVTTVYCQKPAMVTSGGFDESQSTGRR